VGETSDGLLGAIRESRTAAAVCSRIKAVATSCACALAVASFPGPIALGSTLTVDSDAGTLSTDGSSWSSSVQWHGVTISAGGLGADGAREYLVHGDFMVDSDDEVTGVLSDAAQAQHPVRFIVGNDAYLDGTFDFSASDAQHRAGGGRGGDGGSGGAGAAVSGDYGAGGPDPFWRW